MHYREFKPSTALSPYIECFWVLEGGDRQTSDGPERLLPDGCVELILNFGTPFLEHLDTNRTATQPTRFLVGQMTGPLLISPLTARVEGDGTEKEKPQEFHYRKL